MAMDSWMTMWIPLVREVSEQGENEAGGLFNILRARLDSGRQAA
jgi:hypothetical protein